jgi:hypothetical protein
MVHIIAMLSYHSWKALVIAGVHAGSVSSSSNNSGVLAGLNARSQTGERYISSGLAVAVLRLEKKNHSPSSGRPIACNASSVQRLSVVAICGVEANTAMESAGVWKNASC